MQKFVELMNTDNRRELHRLMFLKLVFKLYMDVPYENNVYLSKLKVNFSLLKFTF